jgi:hypothetical protein
MQISYTFCTWESDEKMKIPVDSEVRKTRMFSSKLLDAYINILVNLFAVLGNNISEYNLVNGSCSRISLSRATAPPPNPTRLVSEYDLIKDTKVGGLRRLRLRRSNNGIRASTSSWRRGR